MSNWCKRVFYPMKKALLLYKKTAVTLYYMMIISYGVCDTLFGICYIIILHQKGISILEISALMAISGLVGFLFDFPSGIICDIYGRKKVAGIGFGLWGIGFFLFILGKSYGSFLTAAFVMCSATALISGAPISWFIECYMTICDDRKQIDITIQKGRSYVKWGSMAAAMLGGWLLALNLYIPLYIAALIALTVSIMIQMVGEDNCGERKEKFLKSIICLTKEFFKARKLLVVLDYMILSIIPFQLFIMSWQIVVTDLMKLNVEFVGSLLALYMLIQGGGSYISSRLIRKYSVKKLALAGIGISGAGFLAMSISVIHLDLPFFLAGALLYEFGLSMEQTNGMCMAQEYMGSDNRSTFTSAFSASMSFSCFFINIILGIYLEKAGYAQSYGLMVLVYMCVAVYFICMFRKQKI